jgi:phosphatidylglycerol:prolipoprotein diacylglycerol transferase
MGKRFKRFGFDTTWLQKSFIPIIVMAVVGARVVHVIANIGYYIPHPLLVFAVWQGGLSSYGGLAGAIPTALFYLHKYNPEISFKKAFDVATPVLLASWSMGRILGPQFEFAGGGHRTNAWYGMEYAGQVGKRIPVPIFQSIEDFICFLIVLQLVKIYANKMPASSVAFSGLGIWSIERFFDEYLWLAVPRVWDAVEVFALILLAICSITMIYLYLKRDQIQEKVLAPLELGVDA